MSLFGAMNTAVSGLNAQSSAFGNISDNVANSQTVGFKRTDTSFIDFLTNSTATTNTPGAVVARANYVNGVAGSVTQTDNPLGIAVSGQGFFAVSMPTGSTSTGPTFNPQQFYSRAGDFQMDKDGFLVNSAGEYLNGWLADPTTGAINQGSLQPIQMTQLVYNPVATSNIDLSANLPASPATGTGTVTSPISSSVQVYDKVGKAHSITLNWVQSAANKWNVSVVSPDDTTASAIGNADVTFGAATSSNPVPEGTIGLIDNTTTTTASAYALGSPATLQFATDFGFGAQSITLDLGNFGDTSGLTQYAGTQYSPRSITQDGVQPGNYTGLTTLASGSVVASYDNGKTSTIAQIPLVTFNNPAALQRQNGQAFTATVDSGNPTAKSVGTNGAGNLLVKTIEGSNVDIASEFSKLIVAQQSYSANAKIVTTADTLLQTTLQMKQ